MPCLLIYPYDRYTSSLLFESHLADLRIAPVFRCRGSVMIASLYEAGVRGEVQDDKTVLHER